jgi:hypothetical protein
MGNDQYLYIITTNQLRELRQMIHDDCYPFNDTYHWMQATLPDPIWQGKRNVTLSETISALNSAWEGNDMYTFQDAFYIRYGQFKQYFNSLEYSDTYYLFYETY